LETPSFTTKHPASIHGYTSAQGTEDCRSAIAESLNVRFGTDYSAKNLYMTLGAATSISICLSEGVGTTRPFDFVGAPWLDAETFANRMNALKLPGVFFRPAYYIPRFGTYSSKKCRVSYS
jgi:hypothetical protein